MLKSLVSALALIFCIGPIVHAQDEEQTKDGTELQEDAPTFLANAPDFPILKGFGETTDFGKFRREPDGRYIDAWLTGFKPSNDALRLYKKSLPELGWTIESEIDIKDKGPVLVFKRKRERLKITVYAEGNDVSVLRIEISPYRKR